MLIRFEFQSRGFVHVHILVWIAGAPDLTRADGAEEALREFVDAHVRTDAGSEEDRVWTDLQVHCHTFTCKHSWHCKCRFDYPRPASSTTRLANKKDGMRAARWYRGGDMQFGSRRETRDA